MLVVRLDPDPPGTTTDMAGPLAIVVVVVVVVVVLEPTTHLPLARIRPN